MAKEYTLTDEYICMSLKCYLVQDSHVIKAAFVCDLDAEQENFLP